MADTPTKQSKPILWVGITLIVGMLIWGLAKSCNPPTPATTWEKRDTMYLDSFIHDTVPHYIYVEVPNVIGFHAPLRPSPGTTIKWKHDTLTKDSFIVVTRHDTVIKEIAPGFLTNYPNNPKLIRHTLAKDSMKYDLFYPQGIVQSKSYPLNLDKYTYVYEDEVLKVLPGPKRPWLKEVTTGSSMYTLYNPINQSFRLELDGTLNYRQVGLYGRVSVGTTSPIFAPYIGTRVTLK